MMKIKSILYTIILCNSNLFACAVCFGAPDSKMVQGMNAGIMVLLGFILFVLTCIASMIYHFWRKNKEINT